MILKIYPCLFGLLLLLIGCVPSNDHVVEPMAQESTATAATRTPIRLPTETAVPAPSPSETPTIWVAPTLSAESATATSAMATAIYPELVWNDLSPVPTMTPYITNTPSSTPAATSAVYPNNTVTGIVYRQDDHYRIYVGTSSEPAKPLELSLAADSEATEAALANIPAGSTLVVLQGTYFTGDTPYLLVTNVSLANLPYDENTPLTDSYIFRYPRFSFAVPVGWFVDTEHVEDYVVQIMNWDAKAGNGGPGFEYIDLTAYSVNIRRLTDFSIADYIDQQLEFLGPERVLVDTLTINGRSVTHVSLLDVYGDIAQYYLEINGEMILLQGYAHTAPFIERLLETIDPLEQK